MKSPPEQYTDEEARRKTEEFIERYSRRVVETDGNGKKGKKDAKAEKSEGQIRIKGMIQEEAEQ